MPHSRAAQKNVHDVFKRTTTIPTTPTKPTTTRTFEVSSISERKLQKEEAQLIETDLNLFLAVVTGSAVAALASAYPTPGRSKYEEGRASHSQPDNLCF